MFSDEGFPVVQGRLQNRNWVCILNFLGKSRDSLTAIIFWREFFLGGTKAHSSFRSRGSKGEKNVQQTLR